MRLAVAFMALLTLGLWGVPCAAGAAGSADFVDMAKALRAWASPFAGESRDDQIDDPEARSRDMSGVYRLSLTGKASLLITDDPKGAHRIANAKCNPKTGTTTADMVVDKSWPLLVLALPRTDDGMRNVHLVRPGYAQRAQQLFTDEFIGFQVLRYMGFSDTNTFQGA